MREEKKKRRITFVIEKRGKRLFTAGEKKPAKGKEKGKKKAKRGKGRKASSSACPAREKEREVMFND